jgi:hypothetical protein
VHNVATFGIYSGFEIYFIGDNGQSAIIVLNDSSNQALQLYIPSVLPFFTFTKGY